jgi:DNA-binding Lrp family transcriptional regulator
LKNDSSGLNLTPVQQKILEILQDEGPQEKTTLCEKLQLKEADLERELATLRHMEKIRGELKEGKKLIRLW